MQANHCLRFCLAGAVLLQACATPTPPLRVEPHQQVRHSVNETAHAYYQLARQHQQAGDLDLALSGYTYAIARDPRHMEARSAAAAIHARQGRLEQARSMLLAVVAEYPSVSQAHNNLGYVDYLRGDHAAAATHMRAALALDPGNARARNNLALVESALAGPDGPASAPASEPAAPVRLAQAAPPLLTAEVAEVAETAPRMQLVQLLPNVYELKMALAPASTPVPAAAAAGAAMPAAGIEVANGDGTPGLARRVGTLLGKQGVRVARLSNHKPFGLQLTQVQYRRGYAAQAEALGKLLDGPVQLSESASLHAGADVKLVLGRDTRRALALRDAAAGAPVLAAR